MRTESVENGNGIAVAGNKPVTRRNREQGGYVLIMMAAAAFALIGVLGLSVDIGRMFIAKNETQTFCDAAALAAALQLDGTTTGISDAQSAVTNSTNTWNFNTATIGSPTVTFATSLAGPWSANPNPATGYIYARVSATVSERLYFLPAIVSQSTQNVVASATAGQIPITTFPQGLTPYTAVSTNTIGPNFGLVVGNSYDIQWPQFNDTRAGCGPNNPDKCFNQSPCTGDSKASETAVVTAWGANNSGYWGSTSNSTIQQEILDVIQIQAVDVGTNIQPVLSSGTKSSEAGYLDQRASEDLDTTDNTAADYLAAINNGRRLIAVPIVDPVDTSHTNVIGYGQFLLMANGPGTSNYYTRNTNGNDPFCAIYVGSFNVGSRKPGAGGTTGATVVKLVQ
jgi:Flp pilus assembly protein TadG